MAPAHRLPSLSGSLLVLLAVVQLGGTEGLADQSEACFAGECRTPFQDSALLQKSGMQFDMQSPSQADSGVAPESGMLLDKESGNVQQGGNGTTKSQPSCVVEQALRYALRDYVQNLQAFMIPKILRGVFHDALDFNNLASREGSTGEFKLIPGTYGGVDGCLFPTWRVDGNTNNPEPADGHNRNIGPKAFQPAVTVCKKLCEAQGVDGKGSLCSSLKNCQVDLMVLSSLMAVEIKGGPSMPMTWGRKQGDCKSGANNDEVWPVVRIPNDTPGLKVLASGPPTTAIDDAQSFRDAFEKLGFDATDQAALMGAHSFGKLEACAGGLNGIENGRFCNKPDKLDPPLGPANFVPGSDKRIGVGTCKPKMGVVSGCWKGTVSAKNGSKLTPVNAVIPAYARTGSAEGFTDGGVWDRTPKKFDNDYFKVFANQSYDGKNNCCGRVRGRTGGRSCHLVGRMARIIKGGKDIEQWDPNPGIDACSVDWCRHGYNSRRTILKTTRMWHEPADYSIVGKGHPLKRLFRLAGDWALLGNQDTQAAVKRFAQNEQAFFKAWTEAWGKVLSKGYKDLGACSGDSNPAEVGRIKGLLSIK
eukprot:gnl/TRDRNA2_/TRDRNA2_176360_c3_seq8.p1 gnl/TRDRNA2_/TRDRNA2_176360_c3~~gnl/TRDRNA2_/TRDRNA2_176360_c3_seq8.p1  ORF type:complete len:587 (+),score=52.74 gnl/TRDRNA2_/TRDRNA2_176360_c3_seq8:55-1815(+)